MEKLIFVEDMNADELKAAEVRTLAYIEELKTKPSIVQYEASNALDARLAGIRRRIAEVYEGEVAAGVYVPMEGYK